MNEYAKEVFFWVSLAVLITFFVIGFRSLFSIAIQSLPPAFDGMKEAVKGS